MRKFYEDVSVYRKALLVATGRYTHGTEGGRQTKVMTVNQTIKCIQDSIKMY
jgi:DNA replication initiation complex subunit (GINS family)